MTMSAFSTGFLILVIAVAIELLELDNKRVRTAFENSYND